MTGWQESKEILRYQFPCFSREGCPTHRFWRVRWCDYLTPMTISYELFYAAVDLERQDLFPQTNLYYWNFLVSFICQFEFLLEEWFLETRFICHDSYNRKPLSDFFLLTNFQFFLDVHPSRPPRQFNIHCPRTSTFKFCRLYILFPWSSLVSMIYAIVSERSLLCYVSSITPKLQSERYSLWPNFLFLHIFWCLPQLLPTTHGQLLGRTLSLISVLRNIHVPITDLLSLLLFKNTPQQNPMLTCCITLSPFFWCWISTASR
jgi:hypothetical protein